VSSVLGPEPAVSTGQAGLGTEQDQRPLTDQEYQLLQRLLSDPFSLPMQFKTWLISYLEGSDLTLPISAIQGLSSALGITGSGGSISVLPAGIVLPFGGVTAPGGTLLCDGTLYLKSDYVRLSTAIGTTFGGDATHFNVPDLRGRTLAFLGSHASVNALGASDGVAVARRRPQHRHTINDPQHTHQVSVGGSGGGTPNRSQGTTTGELGQAPTYGASTGITVGNDPVNDPLDAPAFLVLNAIITF